MHRDSVSVGEGMGAFGEKDMSEEHTGNKYIRTIHARSPENSNTIEVDVYSVLVAFNVICPATQHAIKKLLCCGVRGKGSATQDLTEARDAISRAIEIQQKENMNA